MDVGAWLHDLGLGQYEQAFRDNDIDVGLLPTLAADDLRELGVASLGHRKRLLAAIAGLSSSAEPQRSTVDRAPMPPPTQVGPQAERRQVTVLFCDLAGSTELAVRLDPEDLREIIGAYQRCVAETVVNWGGFVAKYLGDGALVYFGYPEAHEDDAERAARAGLALIEAVGRLPTPDRLRCRVGLATGLVVVGDLIGAGEAQERGIVGETPNLAARLQALAEPDSLVVGPRTRQFLGGLFECRDLGPLTVKGFAHPVHAHEVVRVSDVENRFEALRPAPAPLVGREEEVELLARRWRRAKSGSGQVVLVSGEPGIGKSRLVAAAMELVATEPHTRLRYFCSPHHQDSALHPIIGQLERAAGLRRDDDAPARLDKLDALLSRTAATAEHRRLLADLLRLPDIGQYPPLELTPQQRKQKTLQALIAQFEALARQQPVLQILEDAHWIDPTTLETMDRVVDLVRRLPVLLVMTFRPEFSAPWVGQPHVTVVSLGRLDQQDGSELIGRITGNTPLPPEIVDEIVDRTDGVPLFIEELTRAVLEAGVDRGDAAGTLREAPTRDVPASLHASLMARFDRLGPAGEVAQIGAVIGRGFGYDLLRAVTAMPEAELQAALRQLTASGLILGRGSPPDASYLFKHALIQDVAYGTLLRRSRRELHARIGETLETGFPEQAAREPELLAHHFVEAEQPERAAEYWFRAGKQAAERSANLEAIRSFSRALHALSKLPEDPVRDRRELAVQVATGTPLIAVHGYAAPETGAAYERARVLCERLGDTDALMACLSGQFAYHLVRGDPARIRELTTEAGRLSEHEATRALRLTEHRFAGQSALYFGTFPEARAALETVVRLYDPALHRPPPVHFVHDPKLYALPYLAVSWWLLGYPDQARRWSAAALDYAGTLRQANLACLVQIYGGAGLDELLRDPVAVRERAELIIDLADQHSLHYFRLSGVILKGWAMTRLGDAAEGLALMRAGSAERMALGVSWYQAHYFCLLAASHLEQGDPAQGLAVLAEAKHLASRTAECMWQAELERVEGELRRADGAPPEVAEGHFRSALATSRAQNAKSFELRAAMSLARLWRDQGRRGDGLDLLAPVYGWFTEGFDTPDLQDARALLDELRSAGRKRGLPCRPARE